MEMRTYIAERSGYLWSIVSIRRNHNACRSGYIKYNGSYLYDAADGNHTSFRELGRKRVSDIYGVYGYSPEYFASFSKIKNPAYLKIVLFQMRLIGHSLMAVMPKASAAEWRIL